MVSDHVVKLCNDSSTVSAELAKDPTVAPAAIIDRLYGRYPRNPCDPSARRQQQSAEHQEAALQCGKWGPTRPSPLFLQAFADALNCLDADVQSGVVSPPLMGSHGTAPLTVVAPLADVIRHCANMIASAEREVFFVTCAWSPSLAQRLIRGALLELSRRAGARNQRVKAHFMYDSAGLSNLTDSHSRVKEGSYTGKSVGLPAPDEIPNVDLEVMNLHTIPLGTLHSKFCVVDGRYAAIMSNNMADNDNLEMMVHLEGPIVESVRDTALITWYEQLKEVHPPSVDAAHPSDSSTVFQNGSLKPQEAPRISNGNHAVPPGETSPLPVHMPDEPHFDIHIADEIARLQNNYQPRPGESFVSASNRILNLAIKKPIPPSAPDFAEQDQMTPYIETTTEQPVPMALVSRPPYGRFGSKNALVPQNEAWLSLIRNAKRDIFIQTPDLNAAPLLPEIVAALGRGVETTIYTCFGYNDLGEMIPGQGGTNDQVAASLFKSLPAAGAGAAARSLLRIYNYVGKDQDHPIHHSFKSRSCHIKLLIVDGSVGVQGSGNQDTQSWFHSQEVNVMIDSRAICKRWRECIDRNQNTKEFGRVAEDGVWRDADGKPGDGYMGNPGMITGLFKGVVGMFMKMEGLGGF
ncbi:IQ calmodulin-binding protein [Cordyceps javanica]|uniref:IQ calmodulin-binding protein n=1 Tax=Cordyceps javanica TaxID=43265 RepID=A0A545UN47_9HYPO|nr:IQ calmodulin-binding protein [Cordyceps javanica]TQW02640.1 IQ calmodulin-binding protein [Cordyceps javanica]